MSEDTARAFVLLQVVLWLMIAVAIWRSYRRTKLRAFLVLGVAVVGWPLIVLGIGMAFHHIEWACDRLWSIPPLVSRAWFEKIADLTGQALVAIGFSAMAYSFRPDTA